MLFEISQTRLAILVFSTLSSVTAIGSERNTSFGEGIRDNRAETDLNLRVFCQSEDRGHSVIGVSQFGDVSKIFSTAFSSECEDIRNQIEENSGCFCGSQGVAAKKLLVCVDRSARPHELGSFTFSMDCQRALKQIAETPKSRTFCQQKDGAHEVTGVSRFLEPTKIFSTTFASDCEDIRSQMTKNSGCFCGSGKWATEKNLVCVDRGMNPRNFGTFTFRSECERALDSLLGVIKR